MFANLMFAAGLLVAAPPVAVVAANATAKPDMPAPALLATPFFQVLTVADGLPSSHVYKIIEDRRGFVWIGTRDGLARYDGAAFRVWRHDAGDPGSIASNDVPTVYADRDGRIWCGGDDGLSMLDPSAGDRFIHYRHDANDVASLSSNDVWAVTSDADGTIWIGGYGGGVDRLDPASGKIAHLHKEAGSTLGLTSDNVLALYFDLTAMPIPDQLRALSAAQKFIETQMTSADLMAIMTFSSGAVQVLQDFTDDRRRLLSILGTLEVGEDENATSTDASSADTGAAFGQNDAEFNIFFTDRQLSALQTVPPGYF